jgi:DNA-directed RNA polymerase subunit E'/Rpb7
MEDDKKTPVYGVYIKNVLQKKVYLSMGEIGKQVKKNLEIKLNNNLIGKCIPEGFIQPNSIDIISYSSGLIDGDNINYNVVFECMICNPVEGMNIECIVRNITKAGISADSIQEDDGYNPLNIFIARDHHYDDTYFNNIKENQKIVIIVIGSRFELNDKSIVVIGKLKHEKNDNQQQNNNKQNNKIKPSITFLED